MFAGTTPLGAGLLIGALVSREADNDCRALKIQHRLEEVLLRRRHSVRQEDNQVPQCDQRRRIMPDRLRCCPSQVMVVVVTGRAFLKIAKKCHYVPCATALRRNCIEPWHGRLAEVSERRVDALESRSKLCDIAERPGVSRHRRAYRFRANRPEQRSPPLGHELGRAYKLRYAGQSHEPNVRDTWAVTAREPIGRKPAPQRQARIVAGHPNRHRRKCIVAFGRGDGFGKRRSGGPAVRNETDVSRLHQPACHSSPGSC